MRRVLMILGLVVVLLVGATAGIYFTGNMFPVIVWLTKPSHGWDPSLKVAPPDYADERFWAAKPGKDSLALYVPQGVENPAGERPVDVFFVHPTGFISGSEWNSPMNPSSRTEENTQWMLANQASAYNGCCNVYAPRYRESSIFRYLMPDTEAAQKANDLAYSDVERAFAYFLEQTKDRPFIIASHSQGTEHAFRLLRDHVDGTPLAGRMVAAYIIGYQPKNADAATLKTVRVCNSADETGCIVHWALYGEGGKPTPWMLQGLICVNPLTWKRDGERAPASLHKGGVPISGRFGSALWGSDEPQGIKFDPLAAPVKAWTWAECRDGLLYVADQEQGPFAGLDMGGKNYHGLDYPLFHMDIRENAAVRVAAYLAAHPPAAVP